MFGLFKKKILKTEEEKRAESLPRTKKVQFEPMKVAELLRDKGSLPALHILVY